MKCPKCGYLGFEHLDRCRNCGYDFSLTSMVSVPELSIRSGRQDLSPLDDLLLVDAAARPPAVAMADAGLDLDRVFGDEGPLPSQAADKPRDELTLLTLLTPELLDDEPLIKRASPPRTPLAVRRATPEVPRVRSEQPRAQTLDLVLESEPSAPASRESAPSAVWPPPNRGPAEHVEDAGVAARFAAVAIDLLILSVIDAAVVYFTMQICGLALGDLDILPRGPLLAFLLVQNGGYLVAFTAGGQTLGKMAAGIRVVPTDAASLDLGHAFLRTLMWFVLAVPAGLGFLTACFSRDHRGLHDRFAGTRVVRAAA